MPHDGTAPTTAPIASNSEPLTYTLEEAAAQLQLSVPTYYRRVREGKLPGRKIGGQWRVPRAALRRYVETGEHATTKAGEAS